MAISPYASQVRPVLARRIDVDPAASVNVGNLVAGVAGAAQQIRAKDQAAADAHAESQHKLAVLEYQQQLRRDTSAAAARWAERKAELDNRLFDMRQNPAQPGAAGHEQAARELWEKHRTEFMAELGGNQELVDLFADDVARTGALISTREHEFAVKTGARKMVDDLDAARQARANGLLRDPSDGNLAAALEQGRRERSVLGLSPDDEAEQERLDRATYKGTVLAGLAAAGNPAAAVTLIDKGFLDDAGDADKVARIRQLYLSSAEAERRAAETAARTAEREQQEAAREAIKQIKVRIDNGGDVSVGEIDQALQAGQAAGLPGSELLEAGYMGSDATYARKMRLLDTPALETRIADLQDRRAAGQLGDDEARLLERAEKELKDRDQETGAKLGKMLKSGIEGRISGVTSLAAMPVARSWAAAEAAGDTQAAVIAGLTNARGRELAVQGAALRKERPEMFRPAKVAGVDENAEIDRQFRTKLGPLADHAGAAYQELRDTALDIMAATSHKWDKANFDRAIEIVYGGNRRSDGTWQGGIGVIGGQQVALPGRWTEEEFARRFARYDFAGAVYGDGRAAGAADIKRNFRLRHAGPGVLPGEEEYLLIGADNQPLLRRRKDGGLEPYRLPVPAKP